MDGMVGSVARRTGLIVAGLAVLGLSFGITLTILDSMDQGDGSDISPADVPLNNDDGTPRNSRVSTLRDLPPPPSGFPFGVGWDGVDGLNARVIGPAPIRGGSLLLSLVATRGAGLHRLGLQLVGVPTNRMIEMTLWVKAPQGTRINVDARDGISARESQNAGTAAFDLSQRALLASSGTIRVAIEPGPSEWMKVLVRMQSADGAVVLYLGLLGPKNSTVFNGEGQHFMFGGIEFTAS
jgi:hypothetical protein